MILLFKKHQTNFVWKRKVLIEVILMEAVVKLWSEKAQNLSGINWDVFVILVLMSL